jgi:hypothetical protein
VSGYDELRAMMIPPNPFLPPLPPLPEPRRQQLAYPMTPTHAAIWAIVRARLAELWPMPDAPEIDLGSWFGDWRGDPLADVRAELQAWLDGPECPQWSSPWASLMAGAR